MIRTQQFLQAFRCLPNCIVFVAPVKARLVFEMDSLQLQWMAIFAAASLGVALLIYDIKNKKVPDRFVTEDTNVKLKIEEVSTHLSLIRCKYS